MLGAVSPVVQNTAIFTPTGTSAGVGFAIPIDTVSACPPVLSASCGKAAAMTQDADSAACTASHCCTVHSFALLHCAAVGNGPGLLSVSQAINSDAQLAAGKGCPP